MYLFFFNSLNIPMYDTNSPAALASKLINNTNRHVFLTGKAGTGKTTFLHHIIAHTHKKCVVCAPTGIAAINAGGVTLHAMFQLAFGAFVPDNSVQQSTNSLVKLTTPSTVINGFKMSEQKRKLIREMELLIIDEVSMLRADILDAVNTVCKIIRRNSSLEFGGVQVLFIGDMLQLPPVIKGEEWAILKNYYKSIYFFDALALSNNAPIYVELDKIYRQKDEVFIALLNNLRNGIITPENIALLNNYYKPTFKSTTKDKYITLTTHNYKADAINVEQLKALTTQTYTYEARVENEFAENNYPVDKSLQLKVGAQIMFVKNDPEKRFYNGKLSTVTALSVNSIEVTFDDKPYPLKIETNTWQNIKYVLNDATNQIEEEVIGAYTQYPIKLAWAITVHKSQGLTFEKAIVDIGQAFAPGQVYVALSRMKSLDGLVMSSYINNNSLTQDATIVEYGTNKASTDTLTNVIQQETPAFLRNYLLQSFDFNELYRAAQMHEASYTAKSEEKSVKQKHHKFAINLCEALTPMERTAVKFNNEIVVLTQVHSPENLEKLYVRVNAAQGYFVHQLNTQSKLVFDLLLKLTNEKNVKIYAKELQVLESLLFKQQERIKKAAALCFAISNNTEYTKADNAKVINLTQRLQDMAEAVSAKYAGEDKPKKDTASKTPTKQVSYDLYKQGKTIAQIAIERKLVAGTIEQHLCAYVAKGELSAFDFITETRLNAMLAIMNTDNENNRATLKQALPDDYTYTEIALAMAFNTAKKIKQ
jgi:nucleoside-triphosphatase THEP1